MKIEKINDNQIRCTLSKQDLAERQINLREFVYGSDRAKDLFHDMIEQANFEFGFETEDSPLMVEAIPLPSESLILLITKVDYAEELDPRFSQFSDPDEDMLNENDDSQGSSYIASGADDVIGLFNKIREEQRQAEESPQKDSVVKPVTDLTKSFEFDSIEQVSRVARVLLGYYDGENDLYKNVGDSGYRLMVRKSSHSPEQFNKICNILSEYATQKRYTPAVGAYYSEHGDCLVGKRALQVMATI